MCVKECVYEREWVAGVSVCVCVYVCLRKCVCGWCVIVCV